MFKLKSDIIFEDKNQSLYFKNPILFYKSNHKIVVFSEERTMPTELINCKEYIEY